MKKKLLAMLLTAAMLCTALYPLVSTGVLAADVTPVASPIYMSDISDRITDVRAHNDNKVTRDLAPADDTQIHIGSKAYDKGIGMHCMPDDPTYVEYDISGLGASSFYAEVGIQNTSDVGGFLDWGSIAFYVEADGVEVFRSETKRFNNEATVIHIDVTGVQKLRLCQTNVDGYACDSGVWGDAKLSFESAPETEPPVETEPDTFAPVDIPADGKLYLSSITDRIVDCMTLDGVVNKDASQDGTLIHIGTKEYAKGLGVHGAPGNPTYMEFDLSGIDATAFYAEVGMQNKSDMNTFLDWGSMIFFVEADGVEIFRSEAKNFGDEATVVHLNVTGVDKLRLCMDNNGGHSCDWAVWGDAMLTFGDAPETEPATEAPDTEPETFAPVTVPADGKLYLSDVTDRLIGSVVLEGEPISKDSTQDGTLIHIGSKEYGKGIGVHGAPGNPTYLEFDIAGLGANRFYAEVGMQNKSDTNVFLDWAEMTFYVEADGVEIFRSEAKKFNDEPTAVSLDITGVEKLRLCMDNNGTHACDWAVWGDAMLVFDEVPETEPEETVPPLKGQIYLSDISDKVTGIYAFNDNELGLDVAPADASPIHIGTKDYGKGLGLHCTPDNPTYVEFDVSSYNAAMFHAYVGMQNVSATGTFLEWGSAIFYILADGEEIWRSEDCNFDDEAVLVNVDITGVKTLRLCVDNNGSHACDWAVWADAMICDKDSVPEPEETLPPEPEETLPDPDTLDKGYAYVSDLNWSESKSLAGNENQRDANIQGEPIWSPDLIMYKKGVGMHCRDLGFGSYIELDIEKYGFTEFAAMIGISVSLTGHDISMASAEFAVYGDGVELYKSDCIKYLESFQMIRVDVTGVKTLRLAVSGVEGISGDWAVWGNALLSVNADVDGLFVPDGDYIFDANQPVETEPEPPESETQPPESETQPPESETQPPESETQPPESETQPIETEPVTVPETDPATEPETRAESETETGSGDIFDDGEGDDGGCFSLLGSGGAILLLLAAAGTCGLRKKED